MIQKQTVVMWKDSDGVEHRTLHEVKVRELSRLLSGVSLENDDDRVAVAEALIANDKKFVDLLTTTESSIPLARAVNGGKKPRKSKRVEALQATIPGTGLPPEILDEAKKAEVAK